jgi:glutamate racemase
MIGVFDSGFGGLTIFREFLKTLPQYDYIYLGDNARAPYGNRSHEAVKRFTEQGVNYLFDKGCKLVIIACNTASSNVLRELQEEYLRNPAPEIAAKMKGRKILGVIRPMVEEVARIAENSGNLTPGVDGKTPGVKRPAGKNLRVGVVGTRGTINSKSYETELRKLNPDLKIYGQACPLLVPLIEEDWADKPETRMILKKYLRYLMSCNVGTLILGCTHYPFLYKEFCRVMGRNVVIPHPGEVVAASLKDYLSRHPEIDSRLAKKGTRHYLTTDIADRFREIGGRFLGQKLDKVEKVDIAK